MGNVIPEWPRMRGDIVLLSTMTGVPRETVRRIVSGRVEKAGFEAVQKVSDAVAELAELRDETKNSGKTVEKQTKSRKSSAAAAKAGA